MSTTSNSVLEADASSSRSRDRFRCEEPPPRKELLIRPVLFGSKLSYWSIKSTQQTDESLNVQIDRLYPKPYYLLAYGGHIHYLHWQFRSRQVRDLHCFAITRSRDRHALVEFRAVEQWGS